MCQTTEKIYNRECIRCHSPFVTEKEEVVWCKDECFSKLKKQYCKKCDKIFYSYGSKVYCSDACRKRECSVCDTIYIPKNNESYCSEDCKQKKFTHICRTCEEPFFKQAQQVKYCSDVCRGVYQSAEKKKRICKNCTRVITSLSEHIIYCSESCIEEYRKKKQRKKELEKQNEKDLEIIVRQRVNELIDRRYDCLQAMVSLIDYHDVSGFTDALKQKILEREEHRCYICHQDKTLEVHHILPQRLGGKHEENNLVTLCKRCHRHIETGERDHAYRKCLKNAKRTYGLLDLEWKEKMSTKYQLVSIHTQLEQLSETLSVLANEELSESLISLDDILDEIRELQER